ncbi:MAG: hypothetical protein QGG54_16095, partial [Gammaproteobacteria bacterium]|nr:hypothetical protein [Gammaproteobacteria bacterium]
SHSNEEGAKFCGGCGENLEPFWAEFDQPDALVQYREELTDYLGDQELEEWEEEELEMRRGELKVTVAAHDALVQEMGGTADDPIPVSILIDTAQIGKFHVGGSSVFSFQFENQTERAIRSVELSFRDTEFSVEEVFSVKTKPIRPGGSTQGQVVATLGQSGAHQLSGEVTVVRTGSDPDQFEFEPITYDVGRDSDTPTNITVDMSNLRVADFEGAQISGSTGTQSGVVSDRSWLPLKLIRISAGAKQEEALLGQLTNLEAIENPAQRFTALCELAQTNPESRVIASALQAAADLFIVVEDTDSVQYWDEFKSLLELVHNANAVALTTKTIEVVAGWAGIAMMWDIGQIAQEDPIEIQPKLGVAAAVIRRLGASGDNPAVGGVAVAEDNLLGSEYSVWMLSGMAKAWGNSELAERARAALTSLDDECLDELDYDDSGEVVAGQGHPNLEFFKYFMERELNEPDFTADALGAKPKQLGPLDPVGENWFDSHEISLELASLVAPDKARGIAMQFAAAGSHKNAYRMNYRAAVDGEDLEALESVGNSLLLGRG